LKSIRTKITISITLLMSMLLFLLAVILFNLFSNSEKDLTLALSKEIVENRVNQMGDWISARKREVEIITNNLKHLQINEIAARDFFKANSLSLYSEYEMFFIAGSDGVGWDSFESGADISDRSYYKDIITEGKDFSISEPLISRGSGKQIVVIAYPITALNGEKKGLFGATVLIDTLTEVASSVDVQGSGYGWLIDRNGSIIAHPEKELLISQNSERQSEEIESIRSNLGKIGNINNVIEYEFENIEKIAITSDVPYSPGWILIVSIPKLELYVEANRINDFMVILIIFIISLTYLACLLLSKSISSPIIAMAKKIESFGGGDISVRIPIKGIDEIAHIAYTFNNMASSLQSALEKSQLYANELEGANEELEASNEELEAVNEELIANNEEIESSYKTIEMLAHEFEDMISLASRLSHSALKKDNEFLKDMLEIAASMIQKADYGSVSVVENNSWKFVHAIGHDLSKLQQLDIDADSFADWGEAKIIHNLQEYDRETKPETTVKLLDEATLPIKTSIISRMSIGNEKLGGFALDIAQNSKENFTFEDLRIVKAFSNMAASFLTLQRFLSQQDVFQKEIIMSIISILELYDPYTKGHSENVAFYSGMIAERLGMKKDTISRVYWTGLVHDIGKILVPPKILSKMDKLTEEEFEIIMRHPDWGAQVLGTSKELKDMSTYVKHHHERWDGKGYPDGLCGENIPLISRIITVADTYDAMTSDRPYRKALSKEIAISELTKNKNTQFDGRIVDIFIEILKNEEI